MVKDKQLAKHLLYITQHCFAALDDSLLLSLDHGTKEEFVKHRTAVGHVMGELLCEIMDPIIWAYPDLDLLPPKTDADTKSSSSGAPPPAEAAGPPEERGEPASDDRKA